MATVAELEARLASVQAAIIAVEGGSQSIGGDGKTLTRADLRTLYAQERALERRIARSSARRQTVAEF